MRSARFVSLALAMLLAMPALAREITVSAAASLTDAFRELGPAFEAARPGVSVRFNFAASGALLQQIAQGAPVDVFVSADQETMDRGADRKLIDNASRRNFATNALVVIEPARGGPGLQSLQDLAGAKVTKLAVGKVATVPAGRYARQLLDAAGLWAQLQPRIVQADSVRQVLDYVARGEVEAGFVYRTDAARTAEVRVVMVPPGSVAVSYPVAVVADSRQQAAARDFVAFLFTDAAQQTLARHGFGRP